MASLNLETPGIWRTFRDVWAKPGLLRVPAFPTIPALKVDMSNQRRQILLGFLTVTSVMMGPAFPALAALKPAGTGGFDHGPLDALLNSCVRPDGNGDNRVGYTALNPKKIKRGGNSLFGSSPWTAKLVSVGSMDRSRDDSGHEIALPLPDDPLSDYGFNCASCSCSNLMRRV